MSAPPSNVVDRLERLAVHAPVGRMEPDALWVEGRRRQRGRWAGVAVAAAALAVVAGAAVSPMLDGGEAPVATSSDRRVIPDHVREPGQWERSFPRAPGPLLAVGLTSVSPGWSDESGWWGLSATTGESRHLDLPDASHATEAPPILSADGEHLAYWIIGDTVDVLPDPEDFGDSAVQPVVGVAVLDLMTGEIDRWSVSSRYGLLPRGLSWSGPVLWWAATELDDGSTTGSYGGTATTRTWDVASGARTTGGRGTVAVDPALGGHAPGGFLSPNGRGFRLVVGRQVAPVVELARSLRFQSWSRPAASPDGARIAGIEEDDDGSSSSADGARALLVGDLIVGTGDEVDLEPVGDVKAEAVLGWRSSHEVVVLTTSGANGSRRTATVVDVNTGAEKPLLDLTEAYNLPQFAAAAWSADVVEAADPPPAPDPRLISAGAFVVLVFCVSLWRSMRRRRGHP